MNFFEHQDRARKKTGKLVLLFMAAVALTVVSVNLVILGISAALNTRPTPEIFLLTTGVTLLIIIGGSFYKSMVLASGGASVARMLGGRPLVPNSGSAEEDRVQNVVEEMAIASGVPVPQVFLLDNEEGINAFAAGWGQDDAVIGVTRGTVQQLTRDELQGVVAHEFGHLLNGDTRLNLRLISVVNGIMAISLIGYILFSSVRYTSVSRSRNNKGAGAVLFIILLGAGLWLVGSVGVLFGRLIQAAVSRQREFLADASAVQFTRNPMGLAGALRKIAAQGSIVHSPHALETAHLFFSTASGFSFTRLLATHPPLEERIAAIDATHVTQPDVTPSAPAVSDAHPAVSMLSEPQQRRPINPADIANSVGEITPQSLSYAADLIATLPSDLVAAARDPFSARGILFAMLISDDGEVRQKQLKLIEQNVEPAAYNAVIELIKPVAALPRGARLPLIDLTIPALRSVSSQQAQRLRGVMRHLVEADGRITLFEYSLQRIIEKQLAANDMEPFEPIEFSALKEVRPDVAVALSALAQATQAQTQRAFLAGAKQLNPKNPPDFVKVSNLGQLDSSLRRLARCAPPLKQRLVEAMVYTVAADGVVNVIESELLRAIVATLSVPLPPILGSRSS